jgi:hypothetical protein
MYLSSISNIYLSYTKTFLVTKFAPFNIMV